MLKSACLYKKRALFFVAKHIYSYICNQKYAYNLNL